MIGNPGQLVDCEVGSVGCLLLIGQQPVSAKPQPEVSPRLQGRAQESACSPVFIVGLSRSGSTLLSRMLDAHSSLAIFPETWCYVILDRLGCLEEFSNAWQYILFLNQIWESLCGYNDPAARVVASEAARRPRFVGPTAPVLESLGKAYATARKARIWGEKTPGHVLWLPQIRNLFPAARVLVCIRDPRDVLVSYDERWGGGRRDTKFLMKSAAQVRYYLNALLDKSVFPPDQIFSVRYEDLTAQPETALKGVCRFLGIEFEAAMLEFYRKHGNVEQDTPDGSHHKLLSQPATAERIGRYREVFSPSQIALIEEFLAAEMNSLGYAVQSAGQLVLSTEEKRARDRGLRLYERMRSGAIRKKFRRRARLKLRAYRCLGRALAALPWRRLAVTSRDWKARVELARGAKPE